MPQLGSWDFLLKQMLFTQLDTSAAPLLGSASPLSGLRVLDFGSGDGSTASHFAARNLVTAVEPSADQLADRFTDHPYTQLVGSLDQLSPMPEGAFDLVLCHNVLEYIEDKPAVLSALLRVLRPGGVLSVVKHNRPGRVFQAAVLLDDPARAQALLDGENSASRFGAIRYYTDEDLLAMCPSCACKAVFGARTFWDLQQDQTKHSDPAWRADMLALEHRVSTLEPYRSAAFFHHLLLQKSLIPRKPSSGNHIRTRPATGPRTTRTGSYIRYRTRPAADPPPSQSTRRDAPPFLRRLLPPQFNIPPPRSFCMNRPRTSGNYTRN